MRLTQPEETELCELWDRRGSLTEPEWPRLYALVYTELIAGSYSELTSLPAEKKRDLVENFFADKVFFTRHTKSHLDHAGALHAFFKNYLKDCIRKKSPPAPEDDPAAEESDGPWRDEPLCGESSSSALLPTAREKIANRASALARELAVGDLGYLLWHHCHDSGPLSKFAASYRIGNYHAKALRLGITRKKTAFHHGYGDDTVLGRWLVKLGIEIAQDNWEAVAAAFGILCDAIRAQMSHLAGEAMPNPQ